MTGEERIPKHLAIIMDGNGRWAEARGLPRSAGHKAGLEVVKNVVPYIFKKGVEVISVYAFSTENWKRDPEEVGFLFELFQNAIEEVLPQLIEENIKIKFIGDKAGLSKDYAYLVECMNQIEFESCQNTGGTFVIAINYGGREEVIHAIKEIVRLNVHPACINERAVAHQLYTSGLPDPDLIIRTAGEQRLSGFLLWQAEYAELYFSRKPWPAFGKKDFLRALKSYSARKRKFGGY